MIHFHDRDGQLWQAENWRRRSRFHQGSTIQIEEALIRGVEIEWLKSPVMSLNSPTLILAQSEFDHLKALQRKKRWDWPATFSTNCRGDIWPFATRGYTPEKEREELRGMSRVIDQVADHYLKVRTDGGRFFIDDFGACYKSDEAGRPLNLFVWFKITP